MAVSTAPSISPGDHAGEMYPSGDAALNTVNTQRMWFHVILTLLDDAKTDAHELHWPAASRIRKDCHDAIRWLLNPASVDYRMTCSMAGVDGLKLHSNVRRMLAPLAKQYREKAELLVFQSSVLKGSEAETARAAARSYATTASLIETGLR